MLHYIGEHKSIDWTGSTSMEQWKQIQYIYTRLVEVWPLLMEVHVLLRPTNVCTNPFGEETIPKSLETMEFVLLLCPHFDINSTVPSPKKTAIWSNERQTRFPAPSSAWPPKDPYHNAPNTQCENCENGSDLAGGRGLQQSRRIVQTFTIAVY